MSIINLLPKDYIKRRQQRRANVLCLLLFALVMAGVLGAAAVSERSIRHTEEVAERVNKAYAEATRMIEQLNQLEARKQGMLRKAEMTSKLLERAPRSTLLAIVTNALPRSASLTKFNLFQIYKVTKPPAAAGSSSGPKTKFQKVAQAQAAQTRTIVGMEVVGLAGTDVDVASFIAKLARCPVIGSVDLVYSQEKVVDEIPVREFKVSMQLKPDVDVIDYVSELGYASSENLRSVDKAAANGARL